MNTLFSSGLRLVVVLIFNVSFSIINAQCPQGTACDDGDPCTINDTCDGNDNCVGTAIDCDDGNPNTTDNCVPGVGCSNVCNFAVGTPCDDGMICTENDTIDANCNCVGTPVTCPDDGNPCTDEQCIPGIGCQSVPASGSPCDDGNPCTINDVCNNGVCSGTPLDCEDGNPCTMNFCHPDTVGGCYSMPAPAGTATTGPNPLCYNYTCNGDWGLDSTAVGCDDGNPYNTDLCDAVSGCYSVCLGDSIGQPCDDGLICTENDTIDANCNCVGTPVTCPDDGNPCTDEVCIPGLGCQSVPASGSPCDDGNPCTINDVCNNGVCSGIALSCDDGDPCTINLCHPDTVGGCYSQPAPAGTPAIGPSVCFNYTCNGMGGLDSTAIDCDDGDPATLDLCDAITGCYSVPLPLGYGLNGFSYQGVARDSNGDVLALQTIAVGFRIRNYAVSGAVVYSEGHTVTTDERGLFTLQIGRGAANLGDFGSLVWAESPKFLEVLLDVNGGTNFTTIGVEELLPVPYALYSKTVDCMRVSLTGDTLYQSEGCYVIIPGISAANHGGQ